MKAFIAIVLLLISSQTELASGVISPLPAIDIMPLPPDHQIAIYFPELSFNYENASITPSCQKNWTLSDDASLLTTGYLLASSDVLGTAVSPVAINSNVSTDWRIEVAIQSEYSTGICTPWFGLSFTKTVIAYNNDGTTSGLTGLALWQWLNAGAGLYADLELTKSTRKAVLTGNSIESVDSGGCTQFVNNTTGQANYVMILQSVGDRISLTYASPANPGTSAVSCFSGVNVTGLGNIISSGSTKINIVSYYSNNGQIKVSKFHFFQLLDGSTPSSSTASSSTTETSKSSTSTSTSTLSSMTTSTAIPSTTTVSVAMVTGSNTTPSTSTPASTGTSTTTTISTKVATTFSMGSNTTQLPSTTATSRNTTSTSTTKPTTATPMTEQTMRTDVDSDIFGAETSESGFPIPGLIVGNIYPVVQVESITTCPAIHPSVRSPDYNTKIYFTFKIDHLINIDPLDQSISVWGTVGLQWQVTACGSNYTAPGMEEKERVFTPDSSAVWRPELLFANSTDDVYMGGGLRNRIQDRMQLIYIPTVPNRTLYFHWSRRSIFNSKCAFDLSRFPFDSQTCDFTFLIEEPTTYLLFGGIYLDGTDMLSNENWRVLDASKEIGVKPSALIKNAKSSYATARLRLARNPYRYLVNYLVPVYVLVTLVFGSFFMPPNFPDRSVFCGTTLLALIVTESDVFKEIPLTSQRVFFGEYILLLTGLVGLVTMYDMAVCCLVAAKKIWIKEKTMSLGSLLPKMLYVRALDIIAFLIGLEYVLLVNIYAAHVINY